MMVAHTKNRKVRRRMIDERCGVHRELDIITDVILYVCTFDEESGRDFVRDVFPVFFVIFSGCLESSRCYALDRKREKSQDR